jgi:hypothetical protein
MYGPRWHPGRAVISMTADRYAASSTVRVFRPKFTLEECH